jgi:hypothetical protein
MKKVYLVIVFCLYMFSGELVYADFNQNIEAYYKLDEISGTRFDSVGSNDLTPVNNPGSDLGIIDNSNTFSDTSLQRLSVSDNSSLSIGSNSLTISAWVYLDSKSHVQDIVGKWDTTADDREYMLWYDSVSDQFKFTVSNDGQTSVTVSASTYGSPSIGDWYFLVGLYNIDNGLIYIQVNDGALDSESFTTGGIYDGGANFQIGSRSSSENPSNHFDGRIDEVGVWKRIINSSERTFLYSSGAGLTYPFNTTLPNVLNTGTSSVGTTSAILRADIISAGSSTVTTRGFVYGTSPIFTETSTENGTFNTGAYTIDIDSLSCNTTYYFAPYVLNSQGSRYGQTKSFTTGACPEQIDISTPSNYQLFQRNSSDMGTINISGTYNGNPASIEASWNNSNYTVIDDSPSGGTFDGELEVESGQGTLSVRFSDQNNINSDVSYVGVGDIFVIAGQSNAQGRGFNNQAYSHATLKASLFGNDDNWKELVDPTDDSTNQVDAVSADGSSGGSIWPLLATHIMSSQNVPVAFIPAALSGASIEEWQRNDSDPDDTSTLYGSLYRRVNSVGNEIKAVLFLQGERDSVLETSDYNTKLQSFAEDINSDFGINVSVAQIGNRDFDTGGSADLDLIRLFQSDAWDNVFEIIPGPVLYDINLKDESGDGLHYKSDSDLQTVANRWWLALKEFLYKLPDSDGRGPILSFAEEGIDRDSVYLFFNESSVPILPSSSIQGFDIKDNDSSVSISSVERINNNSVKINLSSTLSGTSTTVSLGSQNSASGLNILTDSSEFNLPAEPFVDESVSSYQDLEVTTSLGDSQNNSISIENENDTTEVEYKIVFNKQISTTTLTTSDISFDSSTVNSVSNITIEEVSPNNNTVFTITATALGSGNVVMTIEPSDIKDIFYNNGSTSNISTNTIVINLNETVSSSGISSGRSNGRNIVKTDNEEPVLKINELVLGADYNRDLDIGSTGEDVRQLQIFLNRLGFKVAYSGPGSIGNETNYFGNLTRSALIEFQKKFNIQPSVGYFGPLTRDLVNKINAILVLIDSFNN